MQENKPAETAQVPTTQKKIDIIITNDTAQVVDKEYHFQVAKKNDPVKPELLKECLNNNVVNARILPPSIGTVKGERGRKWTTVTGEYIFHPTGSVTFAGTATVTVTDCTNLDDLLKIYKSEYELKFPGAAAHGKKITLPYGKGTAYWDDIQKSGWIHILVAERFGVAISENGSAVGLDNMDQLLKLVNLQKLAELNVEPEVKTP